MIEESKNLKVLYTGGTFDLFHFGHQNFLRQCKRVADKVVVSLNRDEFVERFKGKRPVLNYKERRQSLLHSEYVDEVVKNEQLNPRLLPLGMIGRTKTITNKWGLTKSG